MKYIRLLSIALSGGNYGHKDTYRPLSMYGRKRPRFKILAIIEKITRLIYQDARICIRQQPNPLRFPVFADTMIGEARLQNIIDVIIETSGKVPGDIIETGVWRGGAVALMSELLNEIGDPRTVYGCDSFEGLPRPEVIADKGDTHYKRSELAISLDEVEYTFKKVYGLPMQNVVWVKGFFKDTLPDLWNRRWSIIRLDGDMYESTITALNNLYPNLSPNGYCIIDDYHLPACRAAVDQFRERYGIKSALIKIDDCAVFWKKP